MTNNLSKNPNYLKLIVVCALLVILSTGSFIAVSIAREPYENDHLPQILSDQIKSERVNEREYFWSSYKDGFECGLDQMKKVTQNLNLSTEISDQYHKCHKFVLENGTIYWLQPTNFVQYLVLEKPENNYQLILSETRTSYPGSADELSVRADTKGVIFRYEGYNNPRKIIRLTIKD